MSLRRMFKTSLKCSAGALGVWGVYDTVVTGDMNIVRCLRTAYTEASIVAMYKFRSPQSVQELKEMHTEAAQLLMWTCRQNEGLYIKLGQAVSSLNHLLPPEFSNELKVLYDAAKPVPVKTVRETIETSLGRKIEDVFETFDDEPISTASIAQVHRATIRVPTVHSQLNHSENENKGNADSKAAHQEEYVLKEVAVKVLKPAIKRQMWFDLLMHDIFVELLEFAFELPARWTAQTVRERLQDEADFRIEAAYMSQAKQYLAAYAENQMETKIKRKSVVATQSASSSIVDFPLEKVYVPEVYTDLSTDNVLVTEWIAHATKFMDTDTILSDYNGKNIMQTLIATMGKLIFTDGFVHADPHPANILVRYIDGKTGQPVPLPPTAASPEGTEAVSALAATPTMTDDDGAYEKYIQGRQGRTGYHPQIVLLDFGLCYQHRESFRRDYGMFFKSIFMRDFQAVEGIMERWGVADAKTFTTVHMQKPIDFDEKAAPIHAQREITAPMVAKYQREMKERLQRMLSDSTKFPRELLWTGRSFNYLRALNKSLGAPVNRLNIIAECAAEAVATTSRLDKLRLTLSEQQQRRHDGKQLATTTDLGDGSVKFGEVDDDDESEMSTSDYDQHMRSQSSVGSRQSQLQDLDDLLSAISNSHHSNSQTNGDDGERGMRKRRSGKRVGGGGGMFSSVLPGINTDLIRFRLTLLAMSVAHEAAQWYYTYSDCLRYYTFSALVKSPVSLVFWILPPLRKAPVVSRFADVVEDNSETLRLQYQQRLSEQNVEVLLENHEKKMIRATLPQMTADD